MDVVILSEFCEDFSSTDNDRFFYLAKQISRTDSVEIITSSFRHTTKSQRRQPADTWPFTITFIEEPGYQKNVSIKRIFSHRVWGKNVVRYLKSRKKPDVVYCAIPSLSGPNMIARYCQKNGIRFVIDVQDLWPEAFQMVFNMPVLSNIIFAPLTLLANGIYKRADAICAVSDTYCKRALRVNKKCSDATPVFLGTELSTFDAHAKANPVANKPEGELWLGYCGTLGTSYDLHVVFEALRLLGEKNLRFIVMGDGPLMERFRAEASDLNVSFTGRMPYEKMCGMLAECDIVVNPIVGKSVATIINKHADYAASGKPVLNTQSDKEYCQLVEEYQMGLNCNNGDAEDLSQKLKALVYDEGLRYRMGKNARKCAEEKFDRATTYSLLEDEILREV